MSSLKIWTDYICFECCIKLLIARIHIVFLFTISIDRNKYVYLMDG